MLLTPVINIPVSSSFKMLDLHVNIIFVVLIFGVYLWFNKINVFYLKIILAFAALIFYLLILELIYKKGDYEAFIFLMRTIITVTSAFSFAWFMNKLYGAESFLKFGQIIFVAAVMQGFVFWASFLSNDFRDMMSSIFYRDFSTDNLHLINLRVPGFVDSGGDGLSMNHGLLCVVGYISMAMYYNKTTTLLFYSVFAFLSGIGCLFTGRSGLYLALLFLILSMSLLKDGKFSVNNLGRFFLIIFCLLFLLFSFSTYLGLYGYELMNEFGWEHPVVRALKGFMALSDGNSETYEDETVTYLFKDQTVLPKSVMVFIFGNNYYGNSIDKISDVGYIRFWNGMGLIGLTFFLLLYYVPFHLISRVLKKLHFAHLQTSAIKYLLLIILCYGLIGHFKIFYLNTRVFTFVYFVYLFLIYNQFTSKNLKSEEAT
jgi:hypothetical protein